MAFPMRSMAYRCLPPLLRYLLQAAAVSRFACPDWLPALVNAGRAFVVIGAVYERRANALDESFRDLIREE